MILKRYYDTSSSIDVVVGYYPFWNLGCDSYNRLLWLAAVVVTD